MTKQSVTWVLTGCLAKVVLIVAAEILTIAMCINVFDFGSGATLCTAIAVFCVTFAVVVYISRDKNGNTQKKRHRPMQHVDIDNTPHCPECFSGNTIMDELGNCYCFDCNTHWREEQLL